jgi:AraC-like DNA-binding protein
MDIAVVRAAHLHVYLDELREIGVPVERDLARSRLPPWILEEPDAYVSLSLCLEWLASCSRDVELMEFGYRAARRESLASLGDPLQRAILGAPTGFARLQTLLRCASLEDNVLSLRMQHEGDQIRVISTIEGFTTNPFIALGEWVDLQAIISIVRTAAGPCWSPAEMTFVSRQRPPATVQESFANTRILVGQPKTSILVSRDLLARPCPARGRAVVPAEGALDDDLPEWDFVTALRSAIRPYLPDGHPGLPQMAETLGVSARTMQRRLQQCGRTYSAVVQEARFDVARALLVDPSARIIDIALATGYESPQHFARAFRRLAGMSPTRYRRSVTSTD